MGVNLILDTCALLALGRLVDKGLSTASLGQIAEADEVFVSPISLYEMGVKWKKETLVLSVSPEVLWERSLAVYELTQVPIEARILAVAYNLPDHHRDPFDRIIIAQAKVLDLAVVTFDKVFERYGVRTIS
jgi:PIN domain nuclease of toxin-antitoxin system